jgi:hypothetical protein
LSVRRCPCHPRAAHREPFFLAFTVNRERSTVNSFSFLTVRPVSRVPCDFFNSAFAVHREP